MKTTNVSKSNITKTKKNLQKLLERDKELDILCEKVFEEKALGNLSEERFLKLSTKYDNEQFELKQKIKNLKKIVLEEKSHEMNSDGFLKIVRKYSEIKELTQEILHEFIDKIVVHHREKIDGLTTQKVVIYYKFIGDVEIPKLNKKEVENYKKTFDRKQKTRLLAAI